MSPLPQNVHLNHLNTFLLTPAEAHGSGKFLHSDGWEGMRGRGGRCVGDVFFLFREGSELRK